MPAPSLTVTLIRRGIPTVELLADVRRVAAQLNTDRLSAHRYTQLGRFNATTVIRRFGSWARALRRLRLRPAHLFHVSAQNALRDLRRVACRLNSKTITIADYRAHGRFTADTLRKRFGPWPRALQTAGLKPRHCHGLSDQELFGNLKQLWQQLNRQPRSKDLRAPNSICTVGPYLTRFGSWTQALRAFDASQNPGRKNADPPPPPPRKTKSPDTHPGIQLQIDHKHPRSQGRGVNGRKSANAVQPVQRWEGGFAVKR